MATKVKLKAPTKRRTTFTVRAKTLAKALKVLLARKREWGEFKGTAKWSPSRDWSTVTIAPKQRIELPRWDGHRKAPKPSQKEWNRMLVALKKHEDEHRKIFERSLAKLVQTIEAAPSVTQASMTRMVKRWKKAAKAAQDKFDVQTGRGSKKGVWLTVYKP